MGGCTNCKGKSGCDHRKGEMLESVDRALALLYPTRTWGEPDDTLAAGSDTGLHGMPPDELAALADELAQELGAATFVREGGDDEPCDYIYLRLVISQRARVAAVQQVAVQLVRDGDGFLVRESPRAGVYDAPLLRRMQKLVAILPAYDLLHVDFGEIAHAPPGYNAGPWRELFGGEPAIANYLFYPQPTTMVTTSAL
jgi:hypothetical protein